VLAQEKVLSEIKSAEMPYSLLLDLSVKPEDQKLRHFKKLEDQLFNFVKQDSQLDAVLAPLLTRSNNSAIEKIRRQLVALLLQIYKGKLD